MTLTDDVKQVEIFTGPPVVTGKLGGQDIRIYQEFILFAGDFYTPIAPLPDPDRLETPLTALVRVWETSHAIIQGLDMYGPFMACTLAPTRPDQWQHCPRCLDMASVLNYWREKYSDELNQIMQIQQSA